MQVRELDLLRTEQANNGGPLTAGKQLRLDFLEGRTRTAQRNQQKKGLGADTVLAMERTRDQRRDVNAEQQEAARRRAKKNAHSKKRGVNMIGKRPNVKNAPYPEHLSTILGDAFDAFFRYQPLRTSGDNQNTATEQTLKGLFIAMFDRVGRHFITDLVEAPNGKLKYRALQYEAIRDSRLEKSTVGKNNWRIRPDRFAQVEGLGQLVHLKSLKVKEVIRTWWLDNIALSMKKTVVESNQSRRSTVGLCAYTAGNTHSYSSPREQSPRETFEQSTRRRESVL